MAIFTDYFVLFFGFYRVCVFLYSAPSKVDIFRDTALRYMGYANEVGEAFR